VPVSQRIKESKLLKDIEKQQKTYGTIQKTDIKPQEVVTQEPSQPVQFTLTNITEKIKDVYRRLSGPKKGTYSKLPAHEDDVNDDFTTTLSKSKTRGQTHGTYAILPQEDIDFEQDYTNMAHEKEIQDMMKKGHKKRQSKTQEELRLDATDWPAMRENKQRNESNIRKSILRTDQEELEARIKQGLVTPPPKKTKQKT
jgi:hypothetical protein